MPRASRKDIEAARTLVRARDGHCCKLCGRSIVDRPSAVHHRRRKGMGGSALLERASNLLRVCGHGNKDLCHGEVHGNPDWARDIGWILRANQDPAATPILLVDGWWLLADDGTRTACESPLLAEVGE